VTRRRYACPHEESRDKAEGYEGKEPDGVHGTILGCTPQSACMGGRFEHQGITKPSLRVAVKGKRIFMEKCLLTG
jgi:hypothetical protein